jgi:hypothetical protein
MKLVQQGVKEGTPSANQLMVHLSDDVLQVLLRKASAIADENAKPQS